MHLFSPSFTHPISFRFVHILHRLEYRGDIEVSPLLAHSQAKNLEQGMPGRNGRSEVVGGVHDKFEVLRHVFQGEIDWKLV